MNPCTSEEGKFQISVVLLPCYGVEWRTFVCTRERTGPVKCLSHPRHCFFSQPSPSFYRLIAKRLCQQHGKTMQTQNLTVIRELDASGPARHCRHFHRMKGARPFPRSRRWLSEHLADNVNKNENRHDRSPAPPGAHRQVASRTSITLPSTRLNAGGSESDVTFCRAPSLAYVFRPALGASNRAHASRVGLASRRSVVSGPLTPTRVAGSPAWVTRANR